MGFHGQPRVQGYALEKVLRNIVKMFMEEKLTYKPIRTMTLDRDHRAEIERLRTARRGRRLAIPVPVATLEESRAG